jgi:hypothetical protein
LQRHLPLGDDRLDVITVTYGVDLITFVRDDDGRETPLCDGISLLCVDPVAGFVAEDANRVGQVAGHLVRDVRSTHNRQITDLGSLPIGPPTCSTEYAEVEIVPVTVAEQ